MKNLTDFGKALKKNRETKKISLNEISDFTKIDIHFLESFEKGNFEVVPMVYTRLFLREYSKYIGEDFNVILNKFSELQGEIKNKKLKFEPVDDKNEKKKVHIQQNFTYSPQLIAKIIISFIIIALIFRFASNLSRQQDELSNSSCWIIKEAFL